MWFIILLFVVLISWVCVGIFCGLTDDKSVTNKDVEIIDAYRAIPKMLVIDGVETDIENYEKVIVVGNRLKYRDILDDDVVLLAKSKPNFFKKHDIVLLNDMTLWEIKTAHKDGTYTLTKNDVKDRKVCYDDIKNKCINGFRYVTER